MQAQTFYRYGGPEVLSLQDIPKPVPHDNEVLIKVHAAGVAAGDWHVLRADPFLVRLMMGLFTPKNPVLGFEVSGVIEEVGSAVTDFKKGDAVLAETNGGAFAEYAISTTQSLAKKPKSVSFEDAAALPVSSVTALQAVRDHGKLQKDEKVLVVGASGGVGSYAVQFAKYFGGQVTALISPKSQNKIEPLVDHIVDYTKTNIVNEKNKYDVIIDAAGFRDFKDYESILEDNGRYIFVGGGNKQMFRIMFFGSKKGKVFKNFLAKPNSEDLAYIVDLVAKKKIKVVLDRVFALKDLPKAIEHLEQRKVVGKSIISVLPE